MKQGVYVASCVFSRTYPQLSKSIQQYVSDRFSMPIMRCCVKNYKTKTFEQEMPDWFSPKWKELPAYIDMSNEETMVSVCHNCSAIFQEQQANINILSLWELILRDESFSFPDFSGEEMTVQDCWRSRDNRAEQDAVRGLAQKMNINIVEAKEHHEQTDFCGLSLYRPAPARNLKLAPRRFVKNAQGKFLPHSEEEQKEAMETYCAQIHTEKVIAYCHYCVEGLRAGGKQGFHLAELLFGAEQAGRRCISSV